jgi:hypothetical protein
VSAIVLSFSSYKAYKTCPKSYLLSRVERRRPVEPDYTGTLPGNVVHDLAEAYFKSSPDKQDLRTHFFDSAFDEKFKEHARSDGIRIGPDSQFKTEAEARQLIEQCRDNMVDMIRQYGLDSGDRISEGWFGTWKTPLALGEGLLVSGAFDLLHTVSDISRLFDFKASVSPYRLDPDQLTLYTMAIKRKLGISPAMAGFFCFRMRKVLWHRITPEMESNLQAAMLRAVEKIEALDLPATPSLKVCGTCDYWNTCEESSITAAPKMQPSRPEEFLVSEESVEL